MNCPGLVNHENQLPYPGKREKLISLGYTKPQIRKKTASKMNCTACSRLKKTVLYFKEFTEYDYFLCKTKMYFTDSLWITRVTLEQTL